MWVWLGGDKCACDISEINFLGIKFQFSILLLVMCSYSTEMARKLA